MSKESTTANKNIGYVFDDNGTYRIVSRARSGSKNQDVTQSPGGVVIFEPFSSPLEFVFPAGLFIDETSGACSSGPIRETLNPRPSPNLVFTVCEEACGDYKFGLTVTTQSGSKPAQGPKTASDSAEVEPLDIQPKIIVD